MILIGPVSNALLGWISFSVSFALLLPSAAQADCSQWDMNGEWVFVQTNDTSPTFQLQQSGTRLQGSGHYAYWTQDEYIIGSSGRDVHFVDASVDGTINGDYLEINAYWNNDTIGVYTAKIGAQGRIQGSTYDRQHPQTMANWYSNRTAKCLTGAGGVSPSSITPPVDATQPTIRAQGRVKTGTPGPALSICESARKARALNNPAAPGLEEKCRAAGGIP